MNNARLSGTEIAQNKIDGFNFLQRESKKVYDRIIKILEEAKIKRSFIQDGFCKKINDQIKLIEAPKPIRFHLKFNIYSVWLCVDTNYIVCDYSRTGSSGHGVAYLKKDLYLCGSKDKTIEFSAGGPDFKEITLGEYVCLKAKRNKLQEEYEEEITRYNSEMPSILR